MFLCVSCCRLELNDTNASSPRWSVSLPEQPEARPLGGPTDTDWNRCLLICRRLQNRLTSCGTNILDHLLGSYKVNYERGCSFCSSFFLQKIDNFTVGCAVLIFSYFGLELRERSPHSCWCYCPPWKTVVLEMFWIIKQSSPLHLVLERTLCLLVILWPWASECVKSQYWAIKDAKMRRKKQGKDKGTLTKTSPLSSSQCPTYHGRSSNPFKRFI